MNVNMRKARGILAELRQDLEHDTILIRLREYCIDLALAEGVVERVVDHLRRDSESCCRIAVDEQARLLCIDLLIACNVAQDGERLKRFDELLCPASQFVWIRIFKAVLELATTYTILNGQILHR